MKNFKILALFPVILVGLAGCKNKKENAKPFDWTVYHEDYIYGSPTYEPINVAREGVGINSIVLTGIPEEGIPQTRWDDYPIKLRCFYTDGETIDYDFKEINIPIKYRHELGEVGKHTFDLGFSPMSRTWEFNIIENPDWKGFNCYFFNGSSELIHTQIVGYYECATYNGPQIPNVDTLDNQYRFAKWSQSLDYICQDMQFKATYKTIEKRNYARKPVEGTKHIDSINNVSNQSGSTTLYLGRLYKVPGIFSNVELLGGKNITLTVPNVDFGKYWNEMNQEAINHIKYIADASKETYFHGSVANMLDGLNYNTVIDNRFNYPTSTSIKLEDNVDAMISKTDPYDNILNNINQYVNKVEVITLGSRDAGYYRIAVLFDVDVYLTYSYKKIGAETYELDVHNALTISPVMGTCKYVIQYSETSEFIDTFNTHFDITTETLWACANNQSWSE